MVKVALVQTCGDGGSCILDCMQLYVSGCAKEFALVVTPMPKGQYIAAQTSR